MGIGLVELYIKVKPGVVEEEVARESVHALPAEEDDVETAIDRNVDRGVGICTVLPMDGAVGIPQGEGEPGVALEVGSVDGDLARIGNGCGRQEPREQEQEQEQKEVSVFHKLNSIDYKFKVKRCLCKMNNHQYAGLPQVGDLPFLAMTKVGSEGEVESSKKHPACPLSGRVEEIFAT